MYDSGAFIVKGIETTTLRAGYLKKCDGSVWQAVCDDGWDIDVARQVCNTLGLTQSKQTIRTATNPLTIHGMSTAVHCGNSCLGRRGYRAAGRHICHGQYAGIVCCKSCTYSGHWNFTSAISTDNITCTGAPVQPMTTTGGSSMGEKEGTQQSVSSPNITNTTDKEGAQQSESCPAHAALGGGLGGLCVILAILLVGVVMGWVWSCHSRSRKPKTQER